MDTQRTKGQWRVELLANRSSMRSMESAEEFQRNLESLVSTLRPEIVASYHALAGEPNLALFNEHLQQSNRLVLPSMEGGSLVWRHATELVAGPMGTKSPTGDAVALAEIDLMLIPALAIDHEGYRLGRGGGYYDRALAQLAGKALSRDDKPVRIGVTYADEVVAELPHLPHDVRVHGSLTEVGLSWFV